MPAIRILIADAEVSSRTRLRRLISLDQRFEMVGEFGESGGLIAEAGVLRADILFLDAQLPGTETFAVLRKMTALGLLVILTATDGSGAQRAFDAEAFDYLLKPYCRTRVSDSLRRAQSRIECRRGGGVEPGDATPAPDRIAVKTNGAVVFVKVAEIDWFEAADNYVTLHRGRENYLIRITMAELETKLDAFQFMRVHRSAIVNVDRIRELRPWFRGDYQIILRDGTQVTLKKIHRTKLESRLLLGAA